MSISQSLTKLDTPFLLVDKTKLDVNVSSLKARLAPHDVLLRPHLKTVKSIEGIKHVLDSFDSPATVSTIKEAEVFANAGYTNLIYVVAATRLIESGLPCPVVSVGTTPTAHFAKTWMA